MKGGGEGRGGNLQNELDKQNEQNEQNEQLIQFETLFQNINDTFHSLKYIVEILRQNLSMDKR